MSSDSSENVNSYVPTFRLHLIIIRFSCPLSVNSFVEKSTSRGIHSRSEWTTTEHINVVIRSDPVWIPLAWLVHFSTKCILCQWTRISNSYQMQSVVVNRIIIPQGDFFLFFQF